MNRALGPVARAAVAATAMLLVSPSFVSAHTPVGGAVREFSPGTSLQYRWGGVYPSWFTGALGSAFGADWTTSSYNNSQKPTFSYAAGGAGTVLYDSTTDVPNCNMVAWIGCANNWGMTNWHVWVRDFTRQPTLPYKWIQTTGSCSGTCFDARRVALHEIEHVTLGVTNHDGQGELFTVMGSSTPSSSTTGWDTHHVQKCDEAAFQLKYDLADLAGVYADCFDHMTGHGVDGLVSTATASAPIASDCYGTTLTITGRVAIQSNTNYGTLTLSNNPLASRTVYIDRKLPSSSTWTVDYSSAGATNAITGNNWSRAFSQVGSSGSITYNYRAHYKGEAGVDPAYSGVVSLTWSSIC